MCDHLNCLSKKKTWGFGKRNFIKTPQLSSELQTSLKFSIQFGPALYLSFAFTSCPASSCILNVQLCILM